MFNPNELPHDQQHQHQAVAQPAQGSDQPAVASEPPAAPEPRFTSECMCECAHQAWCLDHIRFAKWSLSTDSGGQMPVLFYRHVLPELVAMDEILAMAPSEDELAGKLSAMSILKERTASIELDKDELPPTPPPPSAADFLPIEAAEASETTAPVATPKVKRETKRRARRDSDDDEEFEPNPQQDNDDDDSDDDNPPIHVRPQQHHFIQTPSMMHPAMLHHMHAQQQQQMAMAALPPQPRNQPRRSTAATGRQDLKDGAYVNLDLVELDGNNDEDEEDDQPEDVTAAGTSNRRGRGLINPQVRQALSAIVEAIAEVSQMKVDDDGGVQHMTIMDPMADMASHAHHLAQMVPQQLGLHPTQLQQLQLMQQHHHQQQMAAHHAQQQAAAAAQQQQLQMARHQQMQQMQQHQLMQQQQQQQFAP